MLQGYYNWSQMGTDKFTSGSFTGNKYSLNQLNTLSPCVKYNACFLIYQLECIWKKE